MAAVVDAFLFELASTAPGASAWEFVIKVCLTLGMRLGYWK
jgi:hypothetical protein